MNTFFTKKKIIWGIILLVLAGGVGSRIVRGRNASQNVVTETSRRQDVEQTVLATAQVVSTTDLSLSFKMNGIVQKVNVKEGQPVKEGEVLASLNQRDLQAALTTARGALAQAQANYRRVVDGASGEEIVVAQRAVDAAQVAVDNAKRSLALVRSQQDVLVENAYAAMLNAGLAAVAEPGNLGTITPTISGTYTGMQQGQYKIRLYATGGGWRFQVSGLETSDGPVSINSVPMGTKGLYIKFSDTSVTYPNNSWVVNIPNAEAATYVSSQNAYQAAVETRKSSVSAAESAVSTAEVALSQAQASMDLKKAQARPAEVEAARAQILSAQGQVQAAEASLDNAVLRAPTDGTVTVVSVKVGEQASALREVMVLQDVGNLHLEANISEANIASVRQGQTIEVTFDALGPERIFDATIQTVNPASTVVSGVVNYKVVASLGELPEIKPGMTANLTILVASKPSVVVVPARAVIAKDGKKVVRMVTDTKKKSFEEVEVATGLEADGGVVEIVSGLREGQEVVTLIKK